MRGEVMTYKDNEEELEFGFHEVEDSGLNKNYKNKKQLKEDKDILQEKAKIRNEEENNPWFCVWVSDAPESQLRRVANAVDGGGKVQLWMPSIHKKNEKIYLYEGYCFIRCTDIEAREFQRKNNATSIKIITVLKKMDGKRLCHLTQEEVEQIKIVEENYSVSDKYGIKVNDIVIIKDGIFADRQVVVKQIKDDDVRVEFDIFDRHQNIWMNIKELLKK